MKITITLNKYESQHLRSPHTFYDSCYEGEEVLKKVQRAIDKCFKKLNTSKRKVFKKVKRSPTKRLRKK